jgi:hypothetical protein
MRTAATFSAPSTSAGTASTAASISALLTRIGTSAKSMLSNFFEYSASAASPRARTSSMMARTTTFTSSETSRLVVRNAAKRCSKPSDA